MSKIYVIGIGPGAYDQMTGKAIRAMNESDAIIGYTVYVDLVKEYFPGKEFMTTPMKKEVDRCVLAFEEAKKGKTVSMICSGDGKSIRTAFTISNNRTHMIKINRSVFPTDDCLW